MNNIINVFNNINIDQKLPEGEREAINDLQKIDKNTLKKALQEEKIKGIDTTFLGIAQAFSDYKVTYNEVTYNGLTDKYEESGFTYQQDAPDWLKNMLEDKDENDFAYFIYKISEFLEIDKKNLEEKTITKETITQLTKIKEAVLKQEIVQETTVSGGRESTSSDSQNISQNGVNTSGNGNNNSGSTENANQSGEKTQNNLSETITITENEIAIDQLYNGVTKQQIIEAVNELKTKNTDLAKKIVELLKTGNIKEIQLALGMEESDNLPLYKRADGRFGKRTLENLKAGKVVDIRSSNRSSRPSNISQEQPKQPQNQLEAQEKEKKFTKLMKKIEKRKEMSKKNYDKAKEGLITDLFDSHLYGDDERFLGLFAEALLKNTGFFTYNDETYYIIFQEKKDPKLTTDKNEYNQIIITQQMQQWEQERAKKANEYTNIVLPNTLRIKNVGGQYYNIQNEIQKFQNNTNSPLLPILSKLKFKSKENAEKFIQITKNYLQTYGYKLIKDSPKYNEKKYKYIQQIKGLIKNFDQVTNLLQNIKLEAELGSSIDNLECWKVLQWKTKIPSIIVSRWNNNSISGWNNNSIVL